MEFKKKKKTVYVYIFYIVIALSNEIFFKHLLKYDEVKE